MAYFPKAFKPPSTFWTAASEPGPAPGPAHLTVKKKTCDDRGYLYHGALIMTHRDRAGDASGQRAGQRAGPTGG